MMSSLTTKQVQAILGHMRRGKSVRDTMNKHAGRNQKTIAVTFQKLLDTAFSKQHTHLLFCPKYSPGLLACILLDAKLPSILDCKRPQACL